MVVESKERERISRQDRQAAGSVYNNNIHTLWGRGTGQIIYRTYLRNGVRIIRTRLR
jgi:hypothetical protein